MKKIIIFLVAILILATPLVTKALIPNDFYYSKQWYLEKIKAPSAWETTTSANDVIVAIIDSGVQIDHPDLKNNIWHNTLEIPNNGIDDDNNGFIDDVNGWNFSENNNNPNPVFAKDKLWSESGLSHGSIIAGIIGAEGNNHKGISGIAWQVNLMPLKVLDELGSGNVRDVIRAIDYAINNGADIINLSFVGLDYSPSLQAAIERAYNAGVLIVAAAGNEQANNNGYDVNKNPLYPVCNDGPFGKNMVIGVAATDGLDQKANFSSYGSNCVDITAPGVSFFGTVPYEPYFSDGEFNDYWDGYWSGTSMAAPVISGSLALILATNPNIGREEAVDILFSSTDNIDRLNPNYIGQLGRGRVNLDRAVDIAYLKLKSIIGKILVTPVGDEKPILDIYSTSGEKEQSFLAYNENFRAGVNVKAGDLNGNKELEIVTGTKKGGGPHVRIFNQNGELIRQFFAYDKNTRFGVEVALADINGDGKKEIITAPSSGHKAEIRIYNFEGKLLKKFLAFPINFTGGVNLAAGDLNEDGKDEIIVGAGSGGGPQVRMFSAQGYLLGQFFAYDKNNRSGVKVEVADIGGRLTRGRYRIITAPGEGLLPELKIFNKAGFLEKSFLVFASKFKNGVSLSVGDIDNNGFDDIIVGAGPGGAPHVRVFDRKGKLLESFYAGESSFNKGVEVSYFSIKR